MLGEETGAPAEDKGSVSDESAYRDCSGGRFVAISKQSPSARAIASVHTLFVTSLSTPISILYNVAYNWSEALMAVAA